jgi:glycosyltransferase involved in cell wall biosynthesis
LPACAPELDPGDARGVRRRPARTSRLSLWDGPYALVATPMGAGEAELLFDAFARAADQRDEVDLVLLDRHDSALERIARSAGLEQRVHFVGRAPREAESAWLQNARVAFVTLAEPLSAGWCGARWAWAARCSRWATPHSRCPTGCAAMEPRGRGPARGALAWDSVADALHRTPAVGAAIQRGRALAAQGPGAEVAEDLRAALAGARSKRDRAA